MGATVRRSRSRQSLPGGCSTREGDARLSGSEDIDLVLDGKGLDERVPVVLARLEGEGRGDRDDIGALAAEERVDLGEPDWAKEQTEGSQRDVQRSKMREGLTVVADCRARAASVSAIEGRTERGG